MVQIVSSLPHNPLAAGLRTIVQSFFFFFVI
uniref:Uncharacterized protein n=1 Tax=Anguilla anguilla TaxID=7936 RepID=A0A0E9S5D4_ANGAN